jgi:Domain of unknown function (DU1801)
MHPFQTDAVARVYDAYPPAIRERALRLRALIFEVAARAPSVGRIEETLKWGEPAYAAYGKRLLKATSASPTGPRFTPKEKIIGSAVRIGWKASDPDRVRLLFHCQTTLVDSFRERFPREFTFEGNRAMVFESGDALPLKSLAACIAASLTYHAKTSD